MRCSKCGADNRDTARFCDGCGEPVQTQCPSCGALGRPGARFCDACGGALPGPPPGAATPGAASAAGIRFNSEAAAPESLEGRAQDGDRAVRRHQRLDRVDPRSRSRRGARAGRPGAAPDDGGGASLRRLCCPVDRRRHLRPVRRAAWRTRTIRSARSMRRSRCSRRSASTQRHTWWRVIPQSRRALG